MRWKALSSVFAGVLVLITAGAVVGLTLQYGPAMPDWPQEARGIRISAELARDSFGYGEPIMVLVRLKNTADQDQVVRTSRYFWKFRGRDEESGASVPPTRYGRYIAGELPNQPRHFGVHGGLVSPGGETTELLQLDRILDLTMPGNYTVVVGCLGVHRDDPEVMIGSKPLRFEVGGGGGASGLAQLLTFGGEDLWQYSIPRSLRNQLSEYVSLLAKAATGPEPYNAREELQKLKADVLEAVRTAEEAAARRKEER